ncbi:Rossmann fold nucleotide-binding protein Smf possibly involved in DNA uptake [Bathymodiolus heckerae thiotrophic gill symbiont]|uniref:DNA-processing protein DprA n=1 Tax=Bathymodiolus heckerae thiotrophic gill symbiont TaxID=1052212 RepID=UPI0010B7CFEE|nr:DNA-processing protein DprA [Bathymodiolus heckerae thiotrophic gill symbiont]CAC9443340.1 Rossmann fold nucleotide-binding protein Smf possibly involved in DNA uptake [uncultured Gammaproteobacteria bacterium]SMN13282.1 Rossmann fold nucleotide-binding protein Smf possibly involved in DNA uptake [Bathymodiolus heckerae thiotrophic gill symbiont]SMN15047.1 Rossmann fold nucleotide-binding protein Smf possibly involved in DNA uptake [uncultured Candidatus Thioglobus sp.]
MDLVYWLMLLKAPRVGARTFYKILKVFETPEEVFLASKSARKESGLFYQETLDFLEKNDTSLVQADLDWVKTDGCHILTLIDDAYPQQLKTLADPPPLLYVRGDVACLSKPQLAIVGSRNPSAGGKQNARDFAQSLSQLGIIITSGMASGIDASAHIGALEANAQTIAVCGTGLDRIYPAKHKSLAHQISNKGALISEFCIGTAPAANNFPRRNRIISGLSLGTLVIEASIKSGTMITAKLAAEQCKEVFAIPSSIHNPLSQGCHQLIKQGAKLTESVEDILDELQLDLLASIQKNNSAISTKEIDNTPSVLLKYLSYDAMSIDEMVEKSNLSPQIITQELLLLELEHRVVKVNGFGYVLTK